MLFQCSLSVLVELSESFLQGTVILAHSVVDNQGIPRCPLAKILVPKGTKLLHITLKRVMVLWQQNIWVEIDRNYWPRPLG